MLPLVNAPAVITFAVIVSDVNVDVEITGVVIDNEAFTTLAEIFPVVTPLAVIIPELFTDFTVTSPVTSVDDVKLPLKSPDAAIIEDVVIFVVDNAILLTTPVLML